MGRARFLPIVLTAASFAVALGVVLWTPPVEGQRGLRGQIFIVQARIPRGLSERGLIGFGRSHRVRTFQETTSQPIPERRWQGEMITAFNRSPGDLEFHVLFYDVEGGARRFVQDMSTFISDRSQKTFLQRLRLPRGHGRHEGFQPNHDMEVVVTVRHQEVGKTRLRFGGEEIAHTGRVDF